MKIYAMLILTSEQRIQFCEFKKNLEQGILPVIKDIIS